MKYPISILIVLFILSCSPSVEKTTAFEVQHKGALMNFMHKGDISAKADLNDLQNQEHLYALGAVENLKGEIMIMNSEPYISSVQNEEMIVDHSFDHKASLLVYASVGKWKTFEIPAEITSYQDMEKHIEQVASEVGINTDEPFPFLLKGVAASFDWHVIDWPEGDTEHSHEKHIHSGLNGTITDQEVEILGFYSNSHHAIFTHHSTNMHLHVQTMDGTVYGHLDELVLGRGMTLSLPDL